MAELRNLDPAGPWMELTTTAADWKAADPALLATMLGAAAPHPRLRGDRARAGRRRARARARPLQHRPGGRRRRIDRRPALHGRRQRLAPRAPPVPRQGPHPRPGGIRSTSTALVTPEIQDGAAAHARRDPRPRAGLLPRPRRLDAPAVVRGRRARHQRDRRRRRADGGRQRLGAEARRHQRPHDQLLRRRREQDRLGARDR